MSFVQQTFQRQASLFKQSLKFQEIGTGVFVQRIPARYLARLLDDDADGDDPVARALHRIDAIFRECRDKLVDMQSSVEAIVDEHHSHKTRGALLLAWKLSFDADRRQMDDPVLVGACTLSDFKSTPNFSTDPQSVSSADLAKLGPFFSGDWLYIDALCSKAPGVGRLLVLHAYNLALAQRRDGLIALSYAPRKNAVPESRRLFEQLGFRSIIPNATFIIQRMHGSWLVKSTRDADLKGMAEGSIKVCTRKGLTPRTTESLLWRCPG